MTDHRPREFAEVIGNLMREVYQREIEKVPKELRPMTTDHLINGIVKKWYVNKARSEK